MQFKKASYLREGCYGSFAASSGGISTYVSSSKAEVRLSQHFDNAETGISSHVSLSLTPIEALALADELRAAANAAEEARRAARPMEQWE